LNPAPAARTIHGVPDWLHGLSVFWLAAFVFGVAVLVTAAIYAVVMLLATGERGRAFASISPGLLPPMGIVFALLVGFLAAQVWSSGERAAAAVSEEASSLREVVLLSSEFPGEPEARRYPPRRSRLQISKRWRSACAPIVPARQSPSRRSSNRSSMRWMPGASASS
jgi:MFS family permease